MALVKFFKSKIVIFLVVAIVAGGFVYYKFSGKPLPRLIAVTRGDINEEVIVTGNTRPVENINLAFQTGGKITRVNVDVGDKVIIDESIAELDASEIAAQLKEAEANVAVAQAKLDALKRGTRPEDIQITRTQLKKAEQDLENDYNEVLPVINDAYAKSDDAVRNQLNAFFINADTANPQLTFSTNDSQVQTDVQSQRVIVGSELIAWKNELATLNAAGANSKDTLDRAIKNAQYHLGIILTFLNKTSDALVSSFSIGASTLATYKTNITTAKSETNMALTNVNNSGQAIASQKITVDQENDQLNLQLAGTTKEDIRAQEAVVSQAIAGVAVAQAQLNQTVLRSPINGTVTKQDAKVGQIAAANQGLVSVISTDNLEIDANIPEVDIGKIAVGQDVLITLDAFSGETFDGKVVKIDPAETVAEGVVNFKITINFNKVDTRVKSGLTANLRIRTRQKTGVLILPQIAIVQNDQGAFVEKYESGVSKEIPVEIGARDQNGNVEIISGVNEGDNVLNVGLKTSQ